MAVVRLGEQRLLSSSDLLLDTVHFDSEKHPLAKIGRKALACNLSDCAAMAVRPVAATVSVALPRTMPLSNAKEIYEGLLSLADMYGVAIVGGDTARWDHPLAIDVAIVAAPFPGIEPVTRSGARAGDRLFVTGPLGGSLLGRHLDFVPRVNEARRLRAALGTALHAMMDISDGLSLDLRRLTQASQVGAVLEETLLAAVISDDARRLSDQDKRSPLDHALSDGEDFELLIAMEEGAQPPGVRLFPVGQVTPQGFSIRRLDGSLEPLEPRGYIH